MKEKEPIVGNTDYGKGEDSAEVNIFKQLLSSYWDCSFVSCCQYLEYTVLDVQIIIPFNVVHVV